MDELTGKTAVVTGAGSGMGRAFVDRFVAAGANVVMADIEEAALVAAADEVRAAGGNVMHHVADVSTAEANQALVAGATAQFGPVDIICLNAGVAPGGPIAELTVKDWEWCLGVNLWGVIHGMNAVLPQMIERDEGHLIFTASIAGHTSNPGLGPYNVSKHGVVTLAETLHRELVTDGSNVGVTCLCPGLVNTRILESDRNRPEDKMNPGMADGMSEEEAALRAMAMEMFAVAKPPAAVAALVLDAIINKQFWLFTDDMFDGAIADRHRHIEERRNPGEADSFIESLANQAAASEESAE